MAYPQVRAADSGNVIAHSTAVGDNNISVTIRLDPVSATGTTGTAVFVAGVLTTATLPS